MPTVVLFLFFKQIRVEMSSKSVVIEIWVLETVQEHFVFYKVHIYFCPFLWYLIGYALFWGKGGIFGSTTVISVMLLHCCRS